MFEKKKNTHKLDTYVVDNHGHRRNVNSTGENVGGDQHLCLTTAELIDDLVTHGTFDTTSQRRNSVALCDHAFLDFRGSLTSLDGG